MTPTFMTLMPLAQKALGRWIGLTVGLGLSLQLALMAAAMVCRGLRVIRAGVR